MSYAVPTLKALADACGASAADLRIVPLEATSPLTPSVKTSLHIEKTPSIPTRVSLASIIPGFDSPADDGECANLLRISRVVIEKSSRTSLNLLKLPEPLHRLALESLEEITQDCATLGEQLLEAEVVRLLLKFDSTAPHFIITSFQTVLTSPWMLGTYAMHCGIDCDRIVPPVTRAEAVDEELQPMADVVLAMIGMTYICFGNRPDSIHAWIEEVVLPWSIEITAYLRRLSGSSNPRKPISTLGNPRKRKREHVGSPSQLRHELTESNEEGLLTDEEAMLRPFVSVWSLPNSANYEENDFWLCSPVPDPFVELLIDLSDSTATPQVVRNEDTYPASGNRKRLMLVDSGAVENLQGELSSQKNRRLSVLPSYSTDTSSCKPPPSSGSSPHDSNLNDCTNAPQLSHTSCVLSHCIIATQYPSDDASHNNPENITASSIPLSTSLVVTQAINTGNYASSPSSTPSPQSPQEPNSSRPTVLIQHNDTNCTSSNKLFEASDLASSALALSAKKFAPISLPTLPHSTFHFSAVPSIFHPSAPDSPSPNKRGRPLARGPPILRTPRTPAKPRRSGSRGHKESADRRSGSGHGKLPVTKPKPIVKSSSLLRLALEASYALRARCDGSVATSSGSTSSFADLDDDVFPLSLDS